MHRVSGHSHNISTRIGHRGVIGRGTLADLVGHEVPNAVAVAAAEVDAGLPSLAVGQGLVGYGHAVGVVRVDLDHVLGRVRGRLVDQQPVGGRGEPVGALGREDFLCSDYQDLIGGRIWTGDEKDSLLTVVRRAVGHVRRIRRALFRVAPFDDVHPGLQGVLLRICQSSIGAEEQIPVVHVGRRVEVDVVAVQVQKVSIRPVLGGDLLIEDQRPGMLDLLLRDRVGFVGDLNQGLVARYLGWTQGWREEHRHHGTRSHPQSLGSRRPSHGPSRRFQIH